MRRFVRRRFLVVLAAVLAIWVWFPVMPAIVMGQSMEPTLHNGQVIMVERKYYPRHTVQRGDIVLFRYDGVTQVKRVHALPGDHVWEIHCDDTEGVFLADPSRLDVVRRFTARPEAQAHLVEVTVPSGTVYALGDGGNISYDSRYYGPVPQKDIIGKVALDEQGTLVAQRAAERVTLYVR